MARLKITRATGEVSEHQITPRIEYAFELYAKKGFHKAFRDDEKQSDVYWLAWECLRTQGAWGTTVPLTLKQTSSAISATNPEYQTTILVNNTTDINGAVGDISTQSITFTCNSPIVVDTTA